MFARGEDLIYEAHEALTFQLGRGRDEDDAFMAVIASMRGRAGEVARDAQACCPGCVTLLLGGMLAASLEAGLDADDPGQDHGPRDDDEGISWDDMLEGRHP
jgi:hypothetical protein